ncbi:MAG: prolyl oligopeptidase family serine peptidase [Candidatus Aquilonibacter sp.]
MILAAVAGPPAGTYVYAISLAGKSLGSSQIVVKHADGGTTITETVAISGQSISTVSVYDDPVQFKSMDLAVGATRLHAAATATGVDFSGAGTMQFDIPRGSRAFVEDGLAEVLVMLPAALTAGSADVDFVTTKYPRVIPFALARSRAAPPEGVPASAVAMTLSAEGVTQTLWYDPTTLVMQAFDGVGGVQMRLVSQSSSTVVPSVAPAAPATPSRFRSRDVTFTSKDGSVLAGTLSYPDGSGPFGCVILLQGSGVNDRNETVGPNPIFAELADALNARGYVVLRYDKRWGGASHSAVPITKVVRSDAVADGVAAVAFVRGASQVDASRVYFLGHSEGGELVMGIDLAGAPVRGIIMLAPLPMNYTAMLERQLARNHTPSAVAAQERAAEKTAYMASFNAVDPVAEVRQVHQPMLLVHGSNDPNVTGDDLQPFIAAAKAAHPTTFTDVELSGDSHLFAQISKAQAAAGVDEATRVTLDPRLIDAIVAWLTVN